MDGSVIPLGLQLPPSASMTVSGNTAGVFPVSFGYFPSEGSRCVSVQYDWTSRTSYAEDLSQLVARGVETTIQGVYVDNSTVAQYVTLSVAGTGQILIVPPYSQGLFPVFFTGTPSYAISVPASAASVTRLILLNVPPQSVGVWAGASGATSTVTGNLNINSVNYTPPPPVAVDYIHNQLISTVNYTANGTGGDTLGLVSYMAIAANGFTVGAGASQHTCAIYGNGGLYTPGNVYQVIGVMGVIVNASTGILTNGCDFYGHGIYNSGGGTITNHYFLYQEQSSGATHEYGAFFTAPVGIGLSAPVFNLDINGAGGNLTGNWLRVGNTTGQLSVSNIGASFFPGYNPGPGGLGVTDLVVGNNGAANPTSSTGNFLYVSACAGAPTGAPTQAAAGRVALTFDTTNHKLWMHDGTVWRGVVLT
jgi:hypothetical protein